MRWLRWQSGGFLRGSPRFNSRHFWFHFLRSVYKRNPYLKVTSQVINKLMNSSQTVRPSKRPVLIGKTITDTKKKKSPKRSLQILQFVKGCRVSRLVGSFFLSLNRTKESFFVLFLSFSTFFLSLSSCKDPRPGSLSYDNF